jgi:KUP system potassium uptake protein
MTANPEGTPLALLHNLEHNKVLHERNIILTTLTDEVPQVNPQKHFEVGWVSSAVWRIVSNTSLI